MEKYYEIDKIAVVLFLPCFEVTSVYDYYESNLFVRQFIYENNGCLVDIFRDKYIASIYDNGRMPSFNYNSINKLREELFTKEELRSGKVSYDRLLEIYCVYNSSFITYNDKEFVIVDTAGIRKKSKVDYGVEKFAVDRAINSIRECDIAILVIDATEGISDQDKKISSIITEAGKGLIIAINKWDLIENKQSSTINKFEDEIEQQAPFLHYVPKIFISAVTKQRLVSIYKEAKKVWEQCTKRVSTSILNKVISDAYAMVPPDTIKNKRLKIYYTTQVKVAPPSFAFFVNKEELMKDSYKRYLENRMRESFGFFGTPIRLAVREKSDKER